MSSRRSAARGREPVKPLLVSQEGEPGRGQLFILDFAALPLTCTPSTVTGFLKEQDFLSQRTGLCLPPSWRKKKLLLLCLSDH